MLTALRIEAILARLPQLTIGVLGDLFLDRYLDIDSLLTEKSIETGLDAYQVVRVRSSPGALGTVINNLAALGVGRVVPVSIIGDDGEGHELRQALLRLKVVDLRRVMSTGERRTPTYTKPMLLTPGQAPRELNRLDIKNRTPTPTALEEWVSESLQRIWPEVDALIVLDQVSEEDCGVVTERVREELAQLATINTDKFVLADSRERIGAFQSVSTKPNLGECELALNKRGIITELDAGGSVRLMRVPQLVAKFAECSNQPVFCTRGEYGILLAKGGLPLVEVPAYPVSGPIDLVGAGDSTSAGITCARAAGASVEEAAAFGCLVASVTIQQIGTTGSASPEQVRRRWQQASGR